MSLDPDNAENDDKDNSVDSTVAWLDPLFEEMGEDVGPLPESGGEWGFER